VPGALTGTSLEVIVSPVFAAGTQAAKPARGLAQTAEPCSNSCMRSLARISAIGIVGLGLGTSAPALGQKGASEPAVAPSNAGPATGTTSAVPAGSSSDSPKTPTSASTRSENRTPGAASNNSDEPKAGGGGYSWSDKKRRSAHKSVKSEALDPKRPLAQAPNFELRPDGSSVVTLLLSHPTEVTRTTAARRVEYRLNEAQIGVSNNTNPLVTAHFPTPLERVVLRRGKHFATLRLDLREDVQPTHQIRSGPAGSSMLEITLPKPTRTYATPTSKAQSKHDGKSADEEPSSKRERRKAKHSAPKSGPGPRL
jgi:hypothetical protein